MCPGLMKQQQSDKFWETQGTSYSFPLQGEQFSPRGHEKGLTTGDSK